MNKNIAISLLVISAIAVVGVGGTISYFSDTEANVGNVIAAGIVDISIAPGGDTVSLPAKITDMKPCKTEYVTINVTNEENSNPVDVWKHIDNVETEENGITEPEQKWYDANPGQAPKNDIDTVIEYDMTVNGEVVIDVNDGITLDNIESYYIYLGRLEPCETMEVIQSYHMKGDTENWAQSDKVTFDMEFLAQQIGAPAPTNNLDFVNIGDPINEAGKDRMMAGWSNTVWPGGAGTWGGGDDGTIRTVSAGDDDTYKTTYQSEPPATNDVDFATIDVDFGAGSNWLYIRHLDGQADGAGNDDAFKVYVNDVAIATYLDQYSTETWVTSKFDTTGYTGIQTVKIELLGGHWSGYATWGQLGISWMKTLPL